MSPSSTTSYSSIITNTNGCKDTTANVTVTVNPLPVFTITGTDTICNGTSTVLTANVTSGGVNTFLWSTGQPTASIIVNTTMTSVYTVMVTDANNCVKIISDTVVVNALPVVSISGPANICIGTAINLTASGANTYGWNTGATTSFIGVAPVTNTTYNVTGTDNHGCTNTASLLVDVNQQPIASVAAVAPYCIGGSTTLTGAGGSIYSWTPTIGLSNSNIANPTANPTSSRTYTLVVTDANGCKDTTTAQVVVNSLPIVWATGNANVCSGSSATLYASPVGCTFSWNTGQTGTPITENPTTTTSYTVTGTDANGCSNTHSVTLTVMQPITNAYVTADHDSICMLGNIVDKLTPYPTGGTWSSNVSVIGSVASFDKATAVTGYNYVVYNYTDLNGCLGSVTTPIFADSTPVINNISIIATGNTKMITYDGSFYDNLRLKVTIGAVDNVYYASNQNPWQAVFTGVTAPAGAPISVFYGSKNGGCVSANAFVGISEIKDEEMRIYPNPVADILHIDLPYEKYQIKVMTALGQVVFDKAMGEGNSFEIQKENWEPGLYLVNIISSEGRTATRKFLVEK